LDPTGGWKLLGLAPLGSVYAKIFRNNLAALDLVPGSESMAGEYDAFRPGGRKSEGNGARRPGFRDRLSARDFPASLPGRFGFTFRRQLSHIFLSRFPAILTDST
jgi:hypothetical protein